MSVLGSLWTRRREAPYFVGLSLVVLATLLAYPLVDWYLRRLAGSGAAGFDWVQPFHFNDFGAYATALARWDQGQVIYWLNGDSYFATYLYPPTYLPLFVPFVALARHVPISAVPLADTLAEVAAVLWGTATVLYLWVGLQVVARELDVSLAWYDRLVGLWALVGFQPLLYSFKLGQVSAFVAGTFCLAFVAMERARALQERDDSGGVPDPEPTASDGGERGESPPSEDGDRGPDPGTSGNPPRDRLGLSGRRGRLLLALLTGAFATVASGIKPYYATAGAYLLRDRRRLIGAFGTGGLLLAGSLVLFGLDDFVAFWDVLTWGKGWGTQPEALYLWHPGYFEPFYAVANWVPALSMVGRIGLIVGVAALAGLARNAAVDRSTFALGLGVYALAAPEVYTQDFVALLLVALVLVRVEFDRSDGRPWIPVLAVGLLQVHALGWRLVVFHLSGGPPFVGLRESLVALFQPGLWGCLLLVGLAAYRTATAPGVPELIPSRTRAEESPRRG